MEGARASAEQQNENRESLERGTNLQSVVAHVSDPSTRGEGRRIQSSLPANSLKMAVSVVTEI